MEVILDLVYLLDEMDPQAVIVSGMCAANLTIYIVVIIFV
jgi:hypothetical protein